MYHVCIVCFVCCVLCVCDVCGRCVCPDEVHIVPCL